MRASRGFRAGAAAIAAVTLGGCAIAGTSGTPPAGGAAPDPPVVGDVASPFDSLAGLEGEREGPGAPEPRPDEAAAVSLEAAELLPDRPWDRHASLEDRVALWIDILREKRREEIRRWLARMGRYEPFHRARCRARGLPGELVWLPLIESGYHPTIRSHAGAVGMWQFMSSTARRYGLTVTALVDERRDPFAATDAALAYIEDLLERFDGSLFLTLAAYNSGENRVERLLRRHDPDAPRADSLYWAIERHLPRETRSYVPKFVAAVRIGEDPAVHGFGRIAYEAPVELDAVAVRDAASIDVLAAAAGVSQEELEALNPHLRRGLTPADGATTVRLPAGSERAFEERFARIPADERVSFVEHRVRGGDTMSEIAATYGVRLVDLLAANDGLRPRRLQIGQRIVIPRGGGGRSASLARVERQASGRTPVEHVVRRGESLWEIARGYGVRVRDIRRWNDLPGGGLIHPGETLVLRAPRIRVYRVQRGDTLSEIALRHGLSASELARFNGLGLSDLIRPGDEMRIPVGGS